MKFLNAELGWIKFDLLPMSQSLDTLAIARRKYPGSPASLDALCRRFGISNATRTLHGALLDSEILSEVYLELVGGRQPDLVLDGSDAADENQSMVDQAEWKPLVRKKPLTQRISDKEKAAHEEFVAALGSDALWTKSC